MKKSITFYEERGRMRLSTLVLCAVFAGWVISISGCQGNEDLITTSQSARAQSVMTMHLVPADMRCEYLVNPVGIDVLNPRLSWIVQSSARGQRQTAYQIRVFSGRLPLQKGQELLWDTGKVESDATLHIPYEGKPLVSSQECIWRVRVWDKDDKISAWSQPACWSMGLLSQDEWKGKWLQYSRAYSTPEEMELKKGWNQESPSPLFRRAFTVEKPIRTATLYICGLGFHEAYLNGAKIGDHVLDPAFTRYDRASLYVTHDVTSRVKQGENAIGVMLGNGWYNVHTKAAWKFNEAPWRGKPSLLTQLRLEYKDGTSELIVSDETWKATVGPVILDGIRQGETYDARREMPGWATASFDDSGWEQSEVVSGPKGILRAQVTTPIKVTETIRPMKLTEPKPGIFVFDLGQNIAGWAQLQVSGPTGTTVKMIYGERLKEDGTVDQKEIQEHVYQDVFHTDIYILRGQGQEVWEPRFTYYGFQYVQVEGYPGTPTLESIRGRVVNTAFKQTGEFSCSNELLNKIQHGVLWSYRGNYHGYPTDCPHREKNGWTGDAHLAVDQAMFNWANGAGYTKWMLDFHDEQKETGELPGIIPTGGWGYHWGNGPAWDSAYLIIPWTMYCYYGDVRILETHFDRFKRYVDYLTTRAEGHIVKIGLGDWAPVKTQTPEALTSTGFYYVDAMITARCAEILGRTADSEKYRTLAGQIKDAFHTTFYKGDGIYDAGSQTALSFPVFCGLVPDSERVKVVSNLVENIKLQNYHIDTGILGAKALYNVLSENGEHETAYRMLTETTTPSYGNWIQQGATTLWEQWTGWASRNHIMFGDIGAWFYKNLAGINVDDRSPDSIAFKHVVIRPRLVGDLTEAKASYQSIRGLIESHWTIQNGRIELTVTVPANTTATVYVPTTDSATITESGNVAKAVAEVSLIKEEGGYAVFNVNSGTYRFSAAVR